MIPDVPFLLNVFFMAVTVVTLYLVARLDEQKKWPAWILVAWLVIQGGLAWSGFYLVTDSMPPRFALTVGPPILFSLVFALLPSGRRYMRTLSLERLTWIHSVRLPVELTLYWLFVCDMVPVGMTFEGNNYDIFSGITAPLIVFFAFRRKILTRGTLIAWNLLCLVLLANIVTYAILAAPTPLQQVAFDQPNRGVLYFPFIWLPAFIVPAVFFAHLAALIKLFSSSDQ